MNYASARCDAGESICVNHFAQRKEVVKHLVTLNETGTATRQEMRPTDQKRVGTHHSSKDT